MTSVEFRLGPYTVRLRQEPGIQCALYHVYLGDMKIGQCISMPSAADCDWLELQQRKQTCYAYSLTPPGHHWERRNAKRRKNTGGAAPARARWEGHVARKRG